MASPTILELELTRHAIEKAFFHHIPLLHLRQVVMNPYELRRNRKGRAGTYLLIGRTHGGQWIVIPVVETEQFGLWRAISVWPCP